MSLHRVLIVAGAILLALQCVKFAGVLSAIHWILVHGRNYMTELRRRERDFSEVAYWDVLDRTGGHQVVPLGVLEYRLMRFAARRSRAVGAILRAGRRAFYDFTGMGLLVAAYLFLAGTPALRDESRGAVEKLAWAMAGLAAMQLVGIFAEACVSYARLGSYGLGWHGATRYAENRRTGSYLTEAKVLVGAVIYAVLLGTFVFYFSAGHGARYDSLTVLGSTPGPVIGDVLTCLYYAVVTFFTADTPGALNGPARLATVILVLQAACALVLAATTATLFIKPEPEAVDGSPAQLPAGDEPEARRPPGKPGRGLVTGLALGVVLVVVARAARRRDRRGSGPHRETRGAR